MPGVCARCCRNVYFAEQRVALGRVWHVFCFSCYCCRKLLDSCTVVPHSNELYCKPCHARLFGANVMARYSGGSGGGGAGATACSAANGRQRGGSGSGGGGGGGGSGQMCPSCPPCVQPSLCPRCCADPCRCQDPCEPGPKMCYGGNCSNGQRRSRPRSAACQSRSGSPGSRGCSPCHQCPHSNSNSNSDSNFSHFSSERMCPVAQVCSPFSCDSPTSRETTAYYNRQHNASRSTSCCACGQCIPCPVESQACIMMCDPCCDPPTCVPDCAAPCSVGGSGVYGDPSPQCPPCSTCNGQMKSRRPRSACRSMPTCNSPMFLPSPGIQSSNSNNMKRAMCNLGGGMPCRRCHRPVYPAEQMLAAGGFYHNCCFCCLCCRQPLEVRSFVEAAGEIYCKQCHTKMFGPCGYGYGVEATLRSPE